MFEAFYKSQKEEVRLKAQYFQKTYAKSRQRKSQGCFLALFLYFQYQSVLPLK